MKRKPVMRDLFAVNGSIEIRPILCLNTKAANILSAALSVNRSLRRPLKSILPTRGDAEQAKLVRSNKLKLLRSAKKKGDLEWEHDRLDTN
jgi:hypothetical protein